MNQENQRIKLTKRLVREALLKLLENKPLQQISVRELCETAGINRSTFYRHYGSPENVLQEIQTDVIQHIIDLADEHGSSVPMREYLERVCEFLWENRKVNRILLSSQTQSASTELFHMTSNALWTVRMFRPEMEDMDPITDQAAMLFVESGCYAVFRWWLQEEVAKTPKEIAGTLCRLIGIAE